MEKRVINCVHTDRVLVHFDGPVVHLAQSLHFNMVTMTMIDSFSSDV